MDKKTPVEDKPGAPIEMPAGKDLDDGDYVEVWSVRPTGVDVTALRLQQRRQREEVWVRGAVWEITPPSFKVQGIPVTTSPGTQFGGLGAAEFFMLLTPGRVVKVQGTLINNQLAAREVRFENFDADEDDHGGV